jgi:SAM-dependent methyltransferase
VVATGLTDELPDIPGVAERWGRDVIHCPYCHGWEVRDRPIAVLSTSSATVHQALLFRQLSADVTVLTHTGPPLTAEQVADLTARGIAIVGGAVTGLETADDVLVGARLADGTVVPCRALVVRPGFTARSSVLESLGLAATAAGAGDDLAFATDPTGATAIPGVWAAGNVADPMLNGVGSAAAGALAGAAVNGDLIAADLEQAHRPHDHEAERYWDDRYQGDAHTHDAEPNPTLVEAAADLAPGTALDLGCGVGTDAIWLAEHGWHVTAVDISRSALERAARRATAAGVGDRIDWRHHDLATTFPPGTYDLVTAHYVHTPTGAPSERMAQSAAAAVAPGGTLLLVGHATPPPSAPDPDISLPTPAEVLESLDLDGDHWQVVTCETRKRQPVGPHGGTHGGPALHSESIVRARRLP